MPRISSQQPLSVQKASDTGAAATSSSSFSINNGVTASLSSASFFASSFVSTARSQLSSAVFSQYSESSSSPLIRGLEEFRKALLRDVAADDWKDCRAEREESVRRSLLSLQSLLSQAAVPSSCSSSFIARCFPELDSLLIAVLQRLSSPAVLSALLDCCTLLLRASNTASKAETAEQQQLRPWPRWLTTPTTARDAGDAALSRLLAASLPSSSSSSVSTSFPSTALRVSCACFMSALSGCSGFDSSAASLWLLSLLPSLLPVYTQEAQTLASRVMELRERGAARILMAVFAVSDDTAAAAEGSSEREAEDDATALSDYQRFRSLCHLVSTIAAIIRSQRHDKPLQRCQPCSNAAFPSLLRAAAQLWRSLLSAAQLFPAPNAAAAFAACAPLQTVLSFLSSSLSPLLHYFSHSGFVTAFAASACSAVNGPTAAPYSSSACSTSAVIDWAELVSSVVLYLRHHRSESQVTAASTQFHCQTIISIVEAMKKTAAACRVVSASACSAPPRLGSQPALQPLSALLSLMEALLLSASSLLLPVSASQDLQVELCHKQVLSLVLQLLVLYRNWPALLPALLSLGCSAFLPLASSLLQLPEMPLDALYAVFGCLSRLLEAAQDEQQRSTVLTAAVVCGVVDRGWWAMEIVAAKGVSQEQQLVLKAGRQWMAALLSRMSWLRSCPAVGNCQLWEQRLSASYGQRAQTWHQRMLSLHQLRSVSDDNEEAAATVSADGGDCEESGEPLTSLSLFLLFLVCRGIRRRAAKDPQLPAPQPVERWEGVQMAGRGIAMSLQQMLVSAQQQQHQLSSSRATSSLPFSVLLHVSLAASLMEEELGNSLSSRAKAVLFSFLVAAAVSVDDLALSLPIECYLEAGSLARWCWRQTAPQLHERLLSSALSRCSAAAADDRLPNRDTQLEKTVALLAEEEGAVLAMVRRLTDALQSWQQAEGADEHHQQQQEAEQVERLLLLSHRLCGCCRGEQLVAAGLLQPLTVLLVSRFHFAGCRSCASRCLCLLGLLHDIVALPASVLVLIDGGFWLAAMDTAARCLISHGPPADEAEGDGARAVMYERRDVQLLCLQVMSAVVRCEQAEGVQAEHLAEVCMADIAVVDSIAALSRHGETVCSSDAPFPRSTACRAGRIQLSSQASLPDTAANGDGKEAAALVAGRFRLQLQVATLQLSGLLLQAVVRAGGERKRSAAVPFGWYRGLLAMDESAMQALSHRCLEARMAGLRFLIAFSSLDAVMIAAGDGEDEAERRLQVGYASLRPLLLAVQSFLLPHCAFALTRTALELLSVLLASSPPIVKRRLRAQPWHSFLVQSRLFSLRAETGTAASPLLSLSQQSNRLGVLLWHLDLLLDDDADGATDCCRDGETLAGQDDDGERCVLRRHLHSVDAELLLPLVFFPALADSPFSSSSWSSPVLCVSSLHRFLRLLPHIHHAQRLQLKARAQLPPHLHAIISFLRLAAQPPPAATVAAASGALPVLLCSALAARAPRDSAAALSSLPSADGVACRDSSASQSSSPSSQPHSQPLTVAPSSSPAVALHRAGWKQKDDTVEEDGGRVECLCPAPACGLVSDVRLLLTCCERRAVAALRLLSAVNT